MMQLNPSPVEDSLRTDSSFAKGPVTDLSEEIATSDVSMRDTDNHVTVAVAPDGTSPGGTTEESQSLSTSIDTVSVAPKNENNICEIDISDMVFFLQETDFVLDPVDGDLHRAIERPQWSGIKTLLTDFGKGPRDDNTVKRLIADIINVVQNEFENGRFLMPQYKLYWVTIKDRALIEAILSEIIRENSFQIDVSNIAEELPSSQTQDESVSDEQIMEQIITQQEQLPNENNNNSTNFEPNDNDVIIGGNRNTTGNQRLRKIVASYLESPEEDMFKIVTSIIDKVAETQGRFVRQNKETNLYEEVGNREIRQKISSVLKAAALKVKRKGQMRSMSPKE